MRLTIEIEYTGQRVIAERNDCPLYEVTVPGGEKVFCLASQDIIDHVGSIILSTTTHLLTTNKTKEPS